MATPGDKIVLLTPTDPAPLVRGLSQSCEASLVVLSSPAELADHLPGATGLVIGSGLYGRGLPQIVRHGMDLKWIQLSASGYDVFIEQGGPEGVPVMRAVGVWGRSVAGHALALLLALLRKVPDILAAQQQSHWSNAGLQRSIASLPGRRVLMLGTGDIGGTLLPALTTLGAEVTVVARTARTQADGRRIHALEELDHLLPQAEAVIAALPSTPQTVGLFGAERLRRLPQGAVVVNVGRGDLIDEDALAHLLREGHLGGAALDVFGKEPLPAASVLWTAPNLILSPHVAAFGDRESLKELAAQIVRNIARLSDGQPPEGLVGTGTLPRGHH